MLPHNGIFLQFTCDLRSSSICRDEALGIQRTRVVCKNLPPVRVDTFIRQADVLRATSRTWQTEAGEYHGKRAIADLSALA